MPDVPSRAEFEALRAVVAGNVRRLAALEEQTEPQPPEDGWQTVLDIDPANFTSFEAFMRGIETWLPGSNAHHQKKNTGTVSDPVIKGGWLKFVSPDDTAKFKGGCEFKPISIRLTEAWATEQVIYIPDLGEYLTCVLAVVPLQLLAYHVATRKGTDVDQPRNLAKSVTVE